MIAAVVETTTYIVINMIVADAYKDDPPLGCILVDATDRECEIGWIYDPDTNTFSPSPSE